MTTPDPRDVRELSRLLDMLAATESNQQRALHLLTSDWLRDRDQRIAARAVA